jgi:adenylate cyclase
VVVVGATDPNLKDVHATSSAPDERTSGAEIHANAIETIRRGLPLAEAPEPVGFLLIMTLAVAFPFAVRPLAPWLSPLVAIGLGGLVVVGAQLSFEGGVIVPVVYPLLALVLAAIATLAVDYIVTSRARSLTRAAFARYVPPQVVDDLVKQAEYGIRLGGTRLEGTVMFCDLRNFTTLAESVEAEITINVLNRYLSEMSEAILDHGGTVVSYMGDGIMAVFGAPHPQADHAARALAAAREMRSVRLDRFNDWLRSEAICDGFQVGIGLASGPVMSGNVGSKHRLEYGAVGDATNVAARLEALTKELGVDLLVAGSTREQVHAEDLVRLGGHDLRGRVAPTELWTLDARESAPAGDAVRHLD